MAQLTLLDQNEILRYLGYKGSEIFEETHKRINKAIEVANETALIRSAYKEFEIKNDDEGIVLLPGDTLLLGKSIKSFLSGYSKAILFCITLGREFDIEIQRSMIKDPSFGVILNACGVTLIEKAADELQREISSVKPKDPLKRFSPGYGDLPLKSQKDFLRLLDAQKSVGIGLNENMLMNPEKSVTAVFGMK